MGGSVKLNRLEREALDRIQDRLKLEGLQISDEGIVLALLRAASQLPESDLMELVRDVLQRNGRR